MCLIEQPYGQPWEAQDTFDLAADDAWAGIAVAGATRNPPLPASVIGGKLLRHISAGRDALRGLLPMPVQLAC